MALTVLPAVALVALGWCGPTPPSLAAPGDGWAAPVGPPTTVLRPFAPPPAAEPWLPGHRGVDLAVTPGDAVRADGAGVVAFAGPVAGTPVVVVDHGGGLRSTFEPVDATARVGVHVRAGDPLGRAGGGWVHCATLCLHWGMLRDRVYVDPLTVSGLGAGCLAVRLLPVDPARAAVPDLAAWAAAGGVSGRREPGGPAAASGPGGRGAGGAIAVAGESAAVVAGATAAAGVTIRRRRRALLHPPGAP